MTTHKPVSLNLNVRGLGQSATMAVKELCRKLTSEGRHVFDFGLGQSPFPVPDQVVASLRESAHEKDYLPVPGLHELREAVATYHQHYDNVEIKPEDVLIGPGSKELMFLLQLTYYGEIVLRSPCWVSYLPQAHIIGRRIHLIETSTEDRWKLTPELLVRSLETANDRSRPRVLVLNYPSNPTGHSYTAEELKELAEVMREFEVIVLSDEIYGRLHHKGEHVSIAQYYPERTIISSGLSKWCGAGGWRLGTFAFPPDLDWLRHSMAAVASETYTSVCAPIQHAAVTAFRGSEEIHSYLRKSRRILEALASRACEILGSAGVRVHPPAGAFYLFLEFSEVADQLGRNGICDGTTLCNRLLEEAGVALLPGAAFARTPSELTARLAYVDFDGAEALSLVDGLPEGASVEEEVLRKGCGRVLQGFERIAEWVGS